MNNVISTRNLLDTSRETSIEIEGNKKVSNAINWINKFVEETTFVSLIKVGEFILKEFFNDDPNMAMSNNPNKNNSYNALLKHPDLLLSKSSLNNAVGIAILKRNSDIPALERLKPSHLVALLPLRKNPDQLTIMVEKIDKEGLSCRQISREIKLFRKKTKRNYSLKRVLPVREHMEQIALMTKDHELFLHVNHKMMAPGLVPIYRSFL